MVRVPTYGRLRSLPGFPEVDGDGIAGIDILTESQSFDITALNQNDQADYTIPDGYSRLWGIMFDPSIQALLYISSQRARQDVLTGFDTKTGKAGFLRLYNQQAEQDVLKFRSVFVGLGSNVAAYIDSSDVATIVQANSLPYKMTITMLYAR